MQTKKMFISVIIYALVTAVIDIAYIIVLTSQINLLTTGNISQSFVSLSYITIVINACLTIYTGIYLVLRLKYERVA